MATILGSFRLVVATMRFLEGSHPGSQTSLETTIGVTDRITMVDRVALPGAIGHGRGAIGHGTGAIGHGTGAIGHGTGAICHGTVMLTKR